MKFIHKTYYRFKFILTDSKIEFINFLHMIYYMVVSQLCGPFKCGIFCFKIFVWLNEKLLRSEQLKVHQIHY